MPIFIQKSLPSKYYHPRILSSTKISSYDSSEINYEKQYECSIQISKRLIIFNFIYHTYFLLWVNEYAQQLTLF